MKIYSLLAFIGLLFFAASCARSIEGETQNFEANMQRLDKLSAKYPAFKAAFNSMREDATKQMETAKALGDEKAKIAGMTAANKIAGPNWVTNLEDFEAKTNAIRDLATKATQQAGDENDKDAARVASRSGEDAIREAQNKLNNASVNSPSDADAIVSSIMSNLSSAESRLNEVVNAAESKKNEGKKAEEEAKTAEDQKKAEEEKKKAPIKCSHCGKMCPAGSTKCDGCGAPLS